MTTIDKQASKHATRIGWDTEAAFEYAYALLTECNCHTEAAALKDAHDKMAADNAEFEIELERQTQNDDHSAKDPFGSYAIRK